MKAWKQGLVFCRHKIKIRDLAPKLNSETPLLWQDGNKRRQQRGKADEKKTHDNADQMYTHSQPVSKVSLVFKQATCHHLFLLLLLFAIYIAAVPRILIQKKAHQAQSLPLNLGAVRHGQLQVTRISNFSSQMQASSRLGEKWWPWSFGKFCHCSDQPCFLLSHYNVLRIVAYVCLGVSPEPLSFVNCP